MGLRKRTYIAISDELASAIDSLVGKRKRSEFLAEVAWREIKRRQQLEAVDRAAGCLAGSDYPESRDGSAAWVRKLRQEGEKRLRRR